MNKPHTLSSLAFKIVYKLSQHGRIVQSAQIFAQ